VMKILSNRGPPVAIFLFQIMSTPGSANYLSHTEYRPTRDLCYAFPYHNETFAIVRATGTKIYCKSNTASAPAKYTKSRTMLPPNARYSVWAEIDEMSIITPLSDTNSACTQTAKSLLCPNENETPLFITEAPTGTEFECRCKEGFFRGHQRSSNDADADCVRCPSDKFCPMHTNRQFSCPANTKLSTKSGASFDGVQRLISLTSPDSYCVADTGYILQHVFVDINALLHESARMTSSSIEFYSTRPCTESASCFQRTLCDVVGQMIQFTSKCAPGQIVRTSPFLVQSVTGMCEECPPDSYCIHDTRFECKRNQSTYGGGHSSEAACRCSAGSYKDDASQCVDISSDNFYSRACRSANDQVCGTLLMCPRGRQCTQGHISISCAAGEYLDTTQRICVSCSVGSYCIGSGLAQTCPLGATTRSIRAMSGRDCFCVPPFMPLLLTGTIAGFVCESTPEARSITNSSSTRGISFMEHNQNVDTVHLKVDSQQSHMLLEHAKVGNILGGTVLVLNSSNMNVMVHFFIDNHELNAVTIAVSSLSLQDTIVTVNMSPLDIVIMAAFLDFDGMLAPANNVKEILYANRPLVLYLMLMDIQKGLVYRGILEMNLHHDSHVLTLLSQTWTPIWNFDEGSYYRTLPVVSQYSVLAYQQSDMAIVQVELALLNRSINRNYTYHDLVKLDLLTGQTHVSRIVSNKTLLEQLIRPSTLQMSSDRSYVSFCDPPANITEGTEGTELARLDLTSWQSVSLLHTTPACRDVWNQPIRLDSHHILVLPTQFIAYRNIFEETKVVFEDTDGMTFGILHLKYVRCGAGAWASHASSFSCVCQSGYKLGDNILMSDVAKGVDGCVLCSDVEICNTDIFSSTNASKCAPGYKLHNAGAHCVLCANDEYCHDSRGHACPLHSSTMQQRGTVEISACICKPGYHYMEVADLGFCHECSRPFFCTDSRQQQCPMNMSTVSDKAESIASCRCLPGFFNATLYSVVSAHAFLPPFNVHNEHEQRAMLTERGCQEAPVGFYTDGVSDMTPCPAGESTLGTQSTSILQCICAGGFKLSTMSNIVNSSRCMPCVRDEVCTAESAGIVGSCTRFYKQVVNQNNDACVCQAGFVDEMAARQGVMRCSPCPTGYYCPQERNPKTQPRVISCPYKTTSHPGTSSVAGCFCKQAGRNLMTSPVPPFIMQCLCASSHYESMDGVCKMCPKNMYVPVQTMFSSAPIVPRVLACVCIAGFYRQERAITENNFDGAECIICPVGHFCPAGRNPLFPTPCAQGTFGPSVGQRDERGCLECPLLSMSSVHNVTVHTNASNMMKNQGAFSSVQNVQGSVVDCFVEFIPMYYNRELDFEVCSFVFVAFSTDIRTTAIQQAIARIFQHTLKSVDVVSGFNRIQYSVTLTAAFFSDILAVITNMYDPWSTVRAETRDNPTFYKSAVRYFFCDTMTRIADDLHPGKVDVAVCHLPMDHITTFGKTFSMCYFVICV